MKYNFVRFNNKGPSKEDRISINKSSEITFSSTFCSKNEVFSFKYVILFWDSEKKAIGMHFTNKGDEVGRYAVSHLSKGGGARISAKGFLTQNKIDITIYSGRYTWKRHEDPHIGTLYVIELEEK